MLVPAGFGGGILWRRVSIRRMKQKDGRMLAPGALVLKRALEFQALNCPQPLIEALSELPTMIDSDRIETWNTRGCTGVEKTLLFAELPLAEAIIVATARKEMLARKAMFEIAARSDKVVGYATLPVEMLSKNNTDVFSEDGSLKYWRHKLAQVLRSEKRPLLPVTIE